MFMLNYVTPEHAEGVTAEIYNFFPKRMGVPAPMQLLSVSPELLQIQADSIGHFMRQGEIEHSVLAAIRYLAARLFDYDYCRQLNEKMLMAQGMTKQELEVMWTNPLDSPFDKNENALLAFVVKSLKNPMEIAQDDIEQLKKMGWPEKAIFEATAHGSAMQAHGTLFKTFMKKK